MKIKKIHITLLLILFVSGCGYQSKPIDINFLSSEIDENNMVLFLNSAKEISDKNFDFNNGINEKEAIYIALAQNPDIVAARKKIGISEALVVVSGQIENPVLGMEFGHSRLEHSNSYEWELTQLVTDLIKQSKRKSLAEIKLNQSTQEVLLKERDLIAETKTQYLHVLHKMEMLQIAREASDISNKLKEVAKKRLDAGAVLQVEYNSIDVDSQKAHQQILIAEMDLKIEKQKLSSLLGFHPQYEISLSSSVKFNEVYDWKFDGKKYEKYALNNRIDVKVLELEYKGAEKNLEIQYANRWPMIEIGPKLEDGEGRDDSRGFVLGLEIPLWNQNEGRIKKWTIERERVEKKLKAALSTLKYEVQSNVTKANLSREMIDIYKNKILSLVKMNLELSNKSYQLGKIDLFQETKAQTQYIESKRELLNILFGYKKNVIDLESAIGGSVNEIEKVLAVSK